MIGKKMDPLAHHSDIANTLLRAGRPQEALEAAERTLATHPDYVRSHSVFGWACLKLGRTSEGLASLEHAAEMESESTLFLAQLGQAYGMTGDHAKARAVLADLQARAEREYVADSYFAYVYTGSVNTTAPSTCSSAPTKSGLPSTASRDRTSSPLFADIHASRRCFGR